MTQVLELTVFDDGDASKSLSSTTEAPLTARIIVTVTQTSSESFENVLDIQRAIDYTNLC